MGRMPAFITYDGTELAYHLRGEGEPLICLPGGPMRDSAYLGDLGGLAAGRRLVLLDLRGTGDSAVPADPSTYRVDHQVADVEALRAHLGLERMDLLAHSAGGNLAQLYAAAHPGRLRRLVLVTPTSLALGVRVTMEERMENARRRAGRAPYDAAIPAYESIFTGAAGDAAWDLAAPMFYGPWDEAARAHHAAEAGQSNETAGGGYFAEGAFDPPVTVAALAGLQAEVLLLAGELDCNPSPALTARAAAAFPHARAEVQPGAAHYPWIDAPAPFSSRVERFLATGS